VAISARRNSVGFQGPAPTSLETCRSVSVDPTTCQRAERSRGVRAVQAECRIVEIQVPSERARTHSLWDEQAGNASADRCRPRMRRRSQYNHDPEHAPPVAPPRDEGRLLDPSARLSGGPALTTTSAAEGGFVQRLQTSANSSPTVTGSCAHVRHRGSTFAIVGAHSPHRACTFAIVCAHVRHRARTVEAGRAAPEPGAGMQVGSMAPKGFDVVTSPPHQRGIASTKSLRLTWAFAS